MTSIQKTEQAIANNELTALAHRVYTMPSHSELAKAGVDFTLHTSYETAEQAEKEVREIMQSGAFLAIHVQ